MGETIHGPFWKYNGMSVLPRMSQALPSVLGSALGWLRLAGLKGTATNASTGELLDAVWGRCQLLAEWTSFCPLKGGLSRKKSC